MRQTYLLIILGILFIRFNFYIASIGIDLLPDIIGYLLLFLVSRKLQSYRRTPALTLSGILCIFFFVNELLKTFYYPWLLAHVYTAFTVSLILMIAQILLYVELLKGCDLIHPFSGYQVLRWIYLLLASICILIYVYLCFFGGYLYLMNLSSLIETVYLLCLFFWIGRRSSTLH